MKKDAALILLGAISALGYVLIARANGAEGFPLDDAWIHQTYARNLAVYGQWAFRPGQPSAGSTSPLWTVLLAAGYFLRLDFALWTHALNAFLLGATAWLAYRIARLHISDHGALFIGAVVALEWHLAWAAASGMETVLFGALLMGAWLAAEGRGASSFWCGALIGLAVWTRPEGLTLLPFCAWAAWAASREDRPRRILLLVAGALSLILPYFLFNISLSSRLWPNTFFAKQAEYASLLQRPLWERFVRVAAAPLIGAGALLLPGILAGQRRPQLAWAGAFLLSYALRLPLTYQHGRYLMPIIPTLLVIGGAGMAKFIRPSAIMWRRAIGRAWLAAVVGVTAGFWFLGARALIADVRLINNEMVAVAQWVSSNLPRGTVVAAHDIGALGYFADVQLVDLAGLVSPEVIPFMRDEGRLWQFIRERGAEYFITYPGWCPAFSLRPELKPVFQSGALCQPSNPNLHMTVYRLQGGD